MPIELSVKNRSTRHPLGRNFFSALALGIAALLFTGLATAQTVSVVYNFSGGDLGAPAHVMPAQGRGGKLYGTAYGVNSTMGSIFSVSTNGQPHALIAFDGANGAKPIGGLTLGSDGDFYGVTYLGGSDNLGVLFQMTPAGSYTVLHNFGGGSDGGNPWSPPIQASDGNFYGTTFQNSTVYKYDPSQGYSVIYQFDQAHGQFVIASLIEGTDGRLYGVAETGGTNNCGTIFKLTKSGTPLWYFSFRCGAGGQYPMAPLVQASDGNFYGTTSEGGDGNNGTVFKLDQGGGVSILFRFSGGGSGANPVGLMQATDGNLYGIAGGGSSNQGVLFRITTGGTYAVLDTFVRDTTGGNPAAAPVKETNGLLYGTTSNGGAHLSGTVYGVDLGLGSFIALVGYINHAGGTVQVLGQALAGSTSVTFNGVPSTSINVVSDTYMTAVVPAGATTGPVVVTTPTGTLTSNKNLVIVGSAQ